MVIVVQNFAALCARFFRCLRKLRRGVDTRPRRCAVSVLKHASERHIFAFRSAPLQVRRLLGADDIVLEGPVKCPHSRSTAGRPLLCSMLIDGEEVAVFHNEAEAIVRWPCAILCYTLNMYWKADTYCVPHIHREIRVGYRRWYIPTNVPRKVLTFLQSLNREWWKVKWSLMMAQCPMLNDGATHFARDESRVGKMPA